MICNEGYTIERLIHGMDASYNDIQQWKYKDLVTVFGADPKKSKTFQVKTKQEAEDLFNDKTFSSAPFLQVSANFLLSQTKRLNHEPSSWRFACQRKIRPKR